MNPSSLLCTSSKFFSRIGSGVLLSSTTFPTLLLPRNPGASNCPVFPLEYHTTREKGYVLIECSYHDTDPCFELCVKAQRYYQQHSYPTHVKACSLLSVDEILRLAGVSALTLTPNLLETLAASHEPEATLAERSMFLGGVSKKSDRPMEHLNYVDHEAKFRAAFNDGRGQVQTIQASIYEFISTPRMTCNDVLA